MIVDIVKKDKKAFSIEHRKKGVTDNDDSRVEV